ncbi:MAG: segregation/condensation protein A [Planctomycetaceae bacterium]|nr:segregation/condensation protein A [Planctomycetaceae bacterium]
MDRPYRIELDLFTGPLDLLLYLVRRNELDVADLPIAKITQQFQDFLDVLQELDLDLIGDFVVMASTLVEIKSRIVLPSPEEERAEETIEAQSGDPRSDLIDQLMEYRKFKEAALALERHAEIWQERYPRLSDERPSSGKDPSADRIKEVELWDLVSALSRILKRKEIETQSSIRYDETPLHVFVEQIGEQVRREQEVRFFSLFDEETIRSRIVGMFLAILELIRHHHFRAIQEGDHGDIIILPPTDESIASKTQ